MLRNSFFFLEGFDRDSESEFYKKGCCNWDNFLSTEDHHLPSHDISKIRQQIENCTEAIDSGNGTYFANLLPNNDIWRTWDEFKGKAVYLDIETDGKFHQNAITTIGLHSQDGFECLIKGDNLDKFPEIIKNYQLVVTFYGSGFDLPMIRKRFPDIKMPPLHWDLYFSFKQLGYKGGLKKIEQQLGISRSDETDGLTGKDAIILWNRYMSGDLNALDTLIQYNKEDVVNLETLAEIAYVKHLDKLNPLLKEVLTSKVACY